MLHYCCRLMAGWLLLHGIGFSSVGSAATTGESVTIAYSSFSGHYVPLWTAVEDRLGQKYGLDLKTVYAGRARPQQLLMSGETPLVVATGTGALTSPCLGVKDQVIILTFVNRVPGVIVTKPEIKSAEDLKGKVIGTGRPGALADTMVRYVLRSKLRLIPDRDVKLLPVGEPALALQSIEDRRGRSARESRVARRICDRLGASVRQAVHPPRSRTGIHWQSFGNRPTVTRPKLPESSASIGRRSTGSRKSISSRISPASHCSTPLRRDAQFLV
jgi:hypothetical protein